MPVIQGVLGFKVRGKANEKVDPCRWDMGGKTKTTWQLGLCSGVVRIGFSEISQRYSVTEKQNEKDMEHDRSYTINISYIISFMDMGSLLESRDYIGDCTKAPQGPYVHLPGHAQ